MHLNKLWSSILRPNKIVFQVGIFNISVFFSNRLESFFHIMVLLILAVDGKLLKAHKIVLSICSPYFQTMFIENPCQHPIIILKDMSSKLVSNLLEFMYQGSVNVKQVELQAFMKIAETLQIKGLTTSSKKSKTENSSNTKPEESESSTGNIYCPLIL